MAIHRISKLSFPLQNSPTVPDSPFPFSIVCTSRDTLHRSQSGWSVCGWVWPVEVGVGAGRCLLPLVPGCTCPSFRWQMARAVPAPLLPLQAAPLSLRDFQVAPRSLLPVGRHMLVEAVRGGQPVVLCLTEGPMAAAPLSVPAVADFTDSVPTRLLAGSHGLDGSETIGQSADRRNGHNWSDA